MSVAAASGAVSTHQPTSEQIRLARLIEDKKHDQPEVQEIIRQVLDVVADSNQDDALVALHDCDYDFEKAVALLIEKGHEISREWRTATNHKTGKKQQQKSTTSSKNRPNGLGGDTDENGSSQQRRRDGSGNFKRARGGRSKFQQSHQSQNEPDSQSTNHPSDHSSSQQRPRGSANNYRGRNRGNRGGIHRANDRNRQHDQQDPSLDSSLPSDTVPRSNNVPYQNRRGIDTTSGATAGDGRQLHDHTFDVGNWNGETLIYSRTKKDDEPSTEMDLNSLSKSIQALSESNGQPSSSVVLSSKVNAPDTTAQPTSKPDFDPVEATLQIKNCIGIGQSQQHKATVINSSLGDGKTTINNQPTTALNKPNLTAAKSPGQASNNKATPTPPPRIPQQPVVFSDRFDGGLNKIDVQFGNLGDGFEDMQTGTINTSQPLTFYSKNDSINQSTVVATSNLNAAASSVSQAQRTATLVQHSSNDQSAFMRTTGSANAGRVSDQLPVMNQRHIPSQLQQQSIAMKQVVNPNPYSMHQNQSQLNPQTLTYPSMLMHHPQQREGLTLDNAYDHAQFQLQSDFSAPYYMSPALTSQQQTPGHYLVTQTAAQIQQVSNARPSSSNNAQTSGNTSSSVVSTSASAAAKKGPTLPPGLVLPAATQGYSAQYGATYGVSLPISNQQQTAATQYAQLYDHDHSFSSPFIQYNNPQSAQSPTGVYSSVTPPVQQPNQQQGLHGTNDANTLAMGTPLTENLLLLQQQYSLQHPSTQQQAQANVGHAGGHVNYYVTPTPHTILYPTAPTTMSPHLNAKQQGQQYNQRQTSSSNKEGHFMYNTGSGQVPQGTGKSVGQTQQSGGNKQQHANNNYNNQQNQQRPYQ